MPVTCTFELRSRVAFISVVHPYTSAEWRRALDGLLTDMGSSPVRALVDRRDAGTPSREFVELMVTYFQSHAPHVAGSRAAIVVSDDASYGMARMFASRSEISHVPIDMQVFRDYETAVRWLDVQVRP